MQERRLYPRYPFEQPVELRGPKGDRFQARTCDISVAGMGVQLSHAMVVALAQGGMLLTTGDDFRLVLPGTLNDAMKGELTLDCRVKHVRRLSQNDYQVAVRFVDPTAGQRAGLATLVEGAKSTRSV